MCNKNNIAILLVAIKSFFFFFLLKNSIYFNIFDGIKYIILWCINIVICIKKMYKNIKISIY